MATICTYLLVQALCVAPCSTYCSVPGLVRDFSAVAHREMAGMGSPKLCTVYFLSPYHVGQPAGYMCAHIQLSRVYPTSTGPCIIHV